MKLTGWKKPKLIVLARTAPEDYILVGCKYASGSGPTDFDAQCFAAFTACLDCDIQSPS